MSTRFDIKMHHLKIIHNTTHQHKKLNTEKYVHCNNK